MGRVGRVKQRAARGRKRAADAGAERRVRRLHEFTSGWRDRSARLQLDFSGRCVPERSWELVACAGRLWADAREDVAAALEFERAELYRLAHALFEDVKLRLGEAAPRFWHDLEARVGAAITFEEVDANSRRAEGEEALPHAIKQLELLRALHRQEHPARQRARAVIAEAERNLEAAIQDPLSRPLSSVVGRRNAKAIAVAAGIASDDNLTDKRPATGLHNIFGLGSLGDPTLFAEPPMKQLLARLLGDSGSEFVDNYLGLETESVARRQQSSPWLWVIVLDGMFESASRMVEPGQFSEEAAHDRAVRMFRTDEWMEADRERFLAWCDSKGISSEVCSIRHRKDLAIQPSFVDAYGGGAPLHEVEPAYVRQYALASTYLLDQLTTWLERKRATTLRFERLGTGGLLSDGMESTLEVSGILAEILDQLCVSGIARRVNGANVTRLNALLAQRGFPLQLAGSKSQEPAAAQDPRNARDYVADVWHGIWDRTSK